MTSSLVGSEMCIRDSPPTLQNRGLPLRRPLLLLRAPGQTLMKTTRPLCCLLYTSDAADDM
eukprot:8571894-Prorocentrum_lima.AAC.1